MTDPTHGSVLEAAVGPAKLLVVAVEDEPGSVQSTLFVGPVFSYYEFLRPSERRMTDEEWFAEVFRSDREPRQSPPPRPPFVDLFQAPLRLLPEELRNSRPVVRNWMRREY